MEKQIKTRIINKHATESVWNASSYIPSIAELIVYDVDDAHSFQRFKLGDGITVVSKLPFLSNNPVFVGTTEEYETANAVGAIKEGTIVYITDDELENGIVMEDDVWNEIDIQAELISQISTTLESKGV